MVQLFIRSNGLTITHEIQSVAEVESVIESALGLSPEDFWLRISNGIDWVDATVCARLRGGKGGFGTLLKGQRGRRRKTKNFDACRTLDGDRLGTARKDARIAAWREQKDKEEKWIEMLGGEDPTAGRKRRRQPMAPRAIALPKTNVEAETKRVLQEAAGAAAATASAYATARKDRCVEPSMNAAPSSYTMGLIDELGIGDGSGSGSSEDEQQELFLPMCEPVTL